REATVAWGVKDLRFRNDSGNGVLVTTSYTDGSVTVRIWGTKRYRIEATKSARLRERPFETVHDRRQPGTRPGDCVPQEGVPGFQVNVTRLFFQGGRQVRDEQFHTAYQPEDRIICGSTGPNEGADRPTD
ncbi:MAG: VanW family protein, partial [Actinomycetes bacterium]